MSVVANRQINHSIDPNQINTGVEPQVATPISVTARIDYIHRFSKQAVLVVDNNINNYSQLARQYLANLSQTSAKKTTSNENSQEVNVAFVVASNKLNDIQMRCRLVEQLFANTLFDPEQSLAVSILRLAKQHNDAVTIVIEHAQALSLQLKYELCQLVDIANKTQNTINVVFFAQEQAAQEISTNKDLFDKKISIIAANSGQVLAINHARFKLTRPLLSRKSTIWIGLATLISIIAIFLSWFTLTEHENFSLTSLSSTVEPEVQTKVIQQTPVAIQEKATSDRLTLPAVASPAVASTKEIYSALLGEASDQHVVIDKPAQSADILQALAMFEQTQPANVQVKDKSSAAVVEQKPEEKLPAKPVLKETALASAATPKLPVEVNQAYYLEKNSGYAIQIAGFSDFSVLSEFIQEYKNLEYFSYHKVLNNKKFIVLTSEVFTNKIQAQKALAALPKVIQQRGAFLKSVSIIKREINTVKP